MSSISSKNFSFDACVPLQLRTPPTEKIQKRAHKALENTVQRALASSNEALSLNHKGFIFEQGRFSAPENIADLNFLFGADEAACIVSDYEKELNAFYSIRRLTQIDPKGDCKLQVVFKDNVLGPIFSATPVRPDKQFCKTAEQFSFEINQKAESLTKDKNHLTSIDGLKVNIEHLKGHTAAIDLNGNLCIDDLIVTIQRAKGPRSLNVRDIEAYTRPSFKSDPQDPSKVYFYDSYAGHKRISHVLTIQLGTKDSAST
jgi:hypothetical protein